nr:tRNA (cytosine(34)-C(5))-methyltransferase, mitochondrial [Nothobranchius furzeri]
MRAFRGLSKRINLKCFWCLLFNRHNATDGVLLQIQQNESPNNKVRKTIQKKRPACSVVLHHFDQQYSEELGDLWPSARAVLLNPQSWQYGVMLNRFSTVTDITDSLLSLGFSSLLPQTTVSSLPHNGASTVSNSKYPEGQDTFSPHHISECSPEDFNLQPEVPFHALNQDPRSEPDLSLHHSSLQCYVHPRQLRFPSQAHRDGLLKQYYLLNAASLLPVLALQVRDEERVLDLCSAPGGKAVAIMQSATPALLCCNEPDPHRRDWLSKTLESFLPRSLNNRVIVSAQDGRSFGDSETGFYDKVLVDAPCSNDRSWLYSSSEQRGEQRLKDRAGLPELQAQLLRSALSAVRRGGVVVYSTCTLSNSENGAVVETVLKDFPEAEVEDLWEEIATPLSKCFTFSSQAACGQMCTKAPPLLSNSTMSSHSHRLGILVVPQPDRTWGPMFLSRIRRK